MIGFGLQSATKILKNELQSTIRLQRRDGLESKTVQVVCTVFPETAHTSFGKICEPIRT